MQTYLYPYTRTRTNTTITNKQKNGKHQTNTPLPLNENTHNCHNYKQPKNVASALHLFTRSVLEGGVPDDKCSLLRKCTSTKHVTI